MKDPNDPVSERFGRRATRLLGILALGSVIWSVSFAAFAAWDQGWTTDEQLHLAWSKRLWDEGQTERDSADRFDSKTPIHVPNALLRGFVESQGSDQPETGRFAARVPQLLWLILAYVGVAGLGFCLGGPVASRLAVLLASLDPNLIAHASVVTTDIPFAAATVLVFWAAMSHRQNPSAGKAAALGVLLGVALTAKFSAVLLVPLALGAAFWRGGADRRRSTIAIVACLACAWLTLASAYGFNRMFQPLESSTWKSPLFQKVARAAPHLRSPMPMGFLEGVDRSRSRDALVDWIVVIAGRVSHGPLWYYFLAAWSFKTPIALMILSVACLPWLFLRGRRQPEIAWLLVHQIASLLFFSLAFRTQLGYRFVLMLVPITSVLVAVTVSTTMSRKGLSFLAVLVASLSVAESAPFWGDPLAFSNAVVHPKEKSYLFLANSDIDWTQNRDRWTRFQRRQGLPDNGALNPSDLRLGLNVLTTIRVAGVIPGDPFRWARENLEPRAVAGWTHHYFDVTEEQYDRFLEEARHLQPTPDASQICGLNALGEMDHPGIDLRLEKTEGPIGPRVSVLCVATRKGADLVARADEGRFDLIPSGRPDLRTYLPPGETVQFRLDPGVHAFAVVETPFRRSWLRYRLNAAFAARRHGALLRVIQVETKDLPPNSGLSRWFKAPASVNLP